MTLERGIAFEFGDSSIISAIIGSRSCGPRRTQLLLHTAKVRESNRAADEGSMIFSQQKKMSGGSRGLGSCGCPASPPNVNIGTEQLPETRSPVV